MKKRLCAMLLCLAMLAGLFTVAASADTIPAPPSGYKTEAGSVMAYAVSDGDFDIQGYYDNAWRRTTYNNGGYETYLKVNAQTKGVDACTTEAGGDTVLDLNVAIDFVFTNGGKTLQIVYTVKNTTNAAKTFSLGTGADVQISGDDKAAIAPFADDSGFMMIADEESKPQFNFFGCGYEGVTDVSDFWYGAYFSSGSASGNYRWSGNAATAVFYGAAQCDGEGTKYDSAASWHWADQTVEANGTRTFSIKIGVGGEGSENAARGDGIDSPTGSTELELNAAPSAGTVRTFTVKVNQVALKDGDYTVTDGDTTNPKIQFEESAGLTCASEITVEISDVAEPVAIENKIPHTWEYTLSADKRTISVACGICPESAGAVSLTAPTELEYDELPKPATMTSTLIDALDAPTVAYEELVDGAYVPMNGVPTEAGQYRAKVTMGDTAAVTAYVEYEITESADDSIFFPFGDVYLPFRDVTAGDWFYDAVKDVYGKGLMTGMEYDVFGPEGKVTRAQLVTTLWRLEGQPMDAEWNTFSDVDPQSWYAYAVNWAAAFEIVEGVDGAFLPDQAVTREQMATILYRYAVSRGYDRTGASLAAFADGAAVSEYAANAMQWAVANGLIEGANGLLDPQGSLTRAQMAAILSRFLG